MRDLLIDPFRFVFMQRALGIVVVVGLAAGVLSVHVVLRRMAFLADTLTHTVFPGAAAGLVLGRSIEAGALVTAVVSAVAFAALAAHRRVHHDAALAVLLTSFFGIGVMLVSRQDTFTNDLTALLFGRVLTVSNADLVRAACFGGIGLLLVAALHKELILQAFDPDQAAALGYRLLRFDLALDVAVALVVVAALAAVGSALAIALLVTPAATAALVTRRIPSMLLVSTGVAVASGYLGLVIAWWASVDHGVNVAAGATIVTVLTAAFALAGLASAVAAARQRRSAAVTTTAATA